AGIKPQPSGIDNDFGERSDVLEPHIESLARNRVDHMGGIAHQRETIGNESARQQKSQRMDATGTDRCDLAETKAEAPLKLSVKFGVRQRDDAHRLLRFLGPDDGRTVTHGSVAFQRQDREWPGGKKVLLGPPAMIALMRDGGDDGGLLVPKAVAGNSRMLADRRTRAIGRDKKAGTARLAVG